MTSSTPRQEFRADLIDARSEGAIAKAASIVRAGGVIAMPTDTVYGFAAALDHPAALARLFNMKRRSASKAIPILLSSRSSVVIVTRDFPSLALALAETFWPGALTIVAPAREGLPLEVTARDNRGPTVAVRVPDNRVALEIIAAAGGALAVTSANLSGDAPALSAAAIACLGLASPDAIVDGGPAKGGIPSTIVRVANHTIEVLREGAIPAATIEAAIGNCARETKRIEPGAV